MEKIAIYLRSKNDVNGNPRRLFLILDEEGIVDIVDERNRGTYALRDEYPEIKYPVVAVDIPPSEYKRLLKEFQTSSRRL